MCCLNVLLIKIECKYCKTSFYMCRACFRGHKYCSDKCRKIVRDKSQRKSQNKYRTSLKGRETHNRYEQNRRRIKENKNSKKNMAEQSTKKIKLRVIVFPTETDTKPRCSYCGVYGTIVEAFPPRYYRI